ncbi:hypothetical protein EVAR_94879_1 [Eumeta japonica]|uniref:Uncharacterized protein n=1 Tax=Eumeta variegata TaxID=151549 RepID=A0A4C1V978_EUMVA|nr:hypothetical protein EVAR_94879_1 [Eumeta japonica]
MSQLGGQARLDIGRRALSAAFAFSGNGRKLPEAVLIKFDDPTIGAKIKDHDDCIAISPTSTTFQVQKGYDDDEMKNATSYFKSGSNCSQAAGYEAVNELGKKLAKGQTYMDLSRVKTLEGIALSDLDVNKSLNTPHDEKALTKMLRWRHLP